MAARQLSNKDSEGTTLGQSASDLISFHGETPTSQRAAAILTATNSLFALTGASFVANTSSTVSGLFGLNSTMAVLLFDAIQEIRAVLVGHGLHNGGA
jgi:hypothetical protein